MDTPQSNELILVFECYDFIVTQTDPVTGNLYTDKLIIPPYIEKRVKELETRSFSRLLDIRHPCKYLTSYSVDQLLLELIREDMPLYMVKGKEISCVSDIKSLWGKIKPGADHLLMLSFDRERVCAVKAYLRPQYLKIEKVLRLKLGPEKQSENSGMSQEKVEKDFVPFPTPAGTGWHEVEISFIDDVNVKISIRGKTKRRNYVEMGFKNLRTCKPVNSWYTFLKFRENDCLRYSQNVKSKTEKDIQDLRRRLKAYFGIQDNPIILEHGYKPKFKVSTYENQSRSVCAFSNSDLFDENEDD